MLAPRSAFVTLFIAGILIGFLLGITYSRSLHSLPSAQESMVVQACFSPEGHCSSVVVSWIERANMSVHVAMFTLTLDSIVDALILAKGRGVEVLVVLERDQGANQPTYDTLRAAGIEVRKDNNASFMHSKFAIVDGLIVITGSFNWTRSADSANNENLVVIVGSDVASAFENDFQTVWSSSG